MLLAETFLCFHCNEFSISTADASFVQNLYFELIRLFCCYFA